jgi:hypothetical protein
LSRPTGEEETTMTRTFTTAIRAGRVFADSAMHFAIGSIVAFCALTLLLPLANEALFAAAQAAGVELSLLP